MKRLFALSAVLLSVATLAPNAFAGSRKTSPVVNCTVTKIDDSQTAKEVVEVGANVSISKVYDYNEFIGYNAMIGTRSFPILVSVGGSGSALTANTIKREDQGNGGESYRISDTRNQIDFVVMHWNDSPHGELYIGPNEQMLPLTATLECN